MKGKGKQKELKVLDATGMSKSMTGLIFIVFKLHDGAYNSVSNLEPLPGTTMKDKLYNACMKSVKKYTSLSVVERSNLHVLLSSCVNTVSMDYRTAVENDDRHRCCDQDLIKKPTFKWCTFPDFTSQICRFHLL